MTISDQLELSDEEINITLRRAWDIALRSLAGRVTKPTFETHIRAIRPVAMAEVSEQTADGGATVAVAEVTLGVPSVFTREWVEKRHGTLIAGALEEALDREVRLKFVIQPVAAATAEAGRDVSRSGRTAPERPVGAVLPSTVSTLSTVSTGSTVSSDSTEDQFSTLSTVSTGMPVENSVENVDNLARASAPAYAQAVKPAPAAAKPRTGIVDAEAAAALNERYTFESFVTGQSNRLAHAGAQAVAQSPGQVYNPLFLYGPPGLGKTHLMHAIGNEVLHSGSGKRVSYVSGEQFTTHFITSLREGKGEEFRRRWRSVDVWLVDDIQFIAGKESTKEEFFHTFNALYQSGKQIVISSDRSPRELRTMDERLRSRFESGLIADIAAPDLETRVAILQRKSVAERLRIPDDVLLYIARLVDSNIRTLEGALVKMVAYASLVNQSITTDLAASVLERYYVSPEPAAGSRAAAAAASSGPSLGWSGGAGANGAVSPQIVQKVVAKQFGLAPDALIGRRRDRDVAAPRQIAMHLMREMTGMSLPGIGQMFGGRNHSTVLYACERVREQIQIDDELRQMVEDLTVQARALQQAAVESGSPA